LWATPEIGIEAAVEPAPTEAAVAAQPPDYSRNSDYQLTELGARWDELTRPERDALLREVKLRMAQQRDSDGVLMIRTQRRYGRIYRGDGRYLKIETKVVRVRPAEQGAADRGGFGTGFEQRTAENGLETVSDDPAGSGSQSEPAMVDAPVIRASSPIQ
jgi:hypothetical protein